ncbi:hypothetical protein DFP72DRAFT_1061420 [Ephemerocybe angulata]|uniref:BTB domain-containing protein n=1 Tax=Ephemerocybe angulata TaxID=980116 RepID=A0A8H6IDB5_9AGAR|nr:hypothetical protein DFP72DRAFT_1061420 [Tulosesus angulatus]
MSPLNADTTTRQWSLTGFEWVVKNVSKLRDFVEGVAPADGEPLLTADDFELLKQSPTLGDKYKLEIAPSSSPDDNTRAFLSLYITSLEMDYALGGFESAATMMAAIKCQDEAAGARGARPEWVWDFWQHDWIFRQESEVWECPLPVLSDLLDSPRIRQTNSFVICVQIHTPSGPTIPQQPSVCYVPKDLLDGLESSLDNPNTGDVRFICLERLHPDPSSDLASSPSSLSRQSNSSGSSQSPFSSHITGRKRVIYAHSDILIRRSEYFSTMLTSSFSENTALSHGERKTHTIVVEEAEFETIYWLLKYCYANWLLFKQHDDPHAAAEGVGAGWSAKCLNHRESEWEWMTFHKSGHYDDARSAASGDSVALAPVSRSTSRKSAEEHAVPINPPLHLSTTRPSNTKSTLTTGASGPSRQPTTGPRRSTSNTAAGVSSPAGPSSAPGRSKPIPVPVSTSGFPTGSHYPTSPRVTRGNPDPHPHPTPAPPPASALAMYQVAHRYSMRSLSVLALEHIMSTITPDTCFAMLLASYAWDELHSLVEDYAIEKWDEVSVSEEFERCCNEVAAGEWGADGGTTLMSVFRRLRSPSAPAA